MHLLHSNWRKQKNPISRKSILRKDSNSLSRPGRCHRSVNFRTKIFFKNRWIKCQESYRKEIPKLEKTKTSRYSQSVNQPYAVTIGRPTAQLIKRMNDPKTEKQDCNPTNQSINQGQHYILKTTHHRQSGFVQKNSCSATSGRRKQISRYSNSQSTLTTLPLCPCSSTTFDRSKINWLAYSAHHQSDLDWSPFACSFLLPASANARRIQKAQQSRCVSLSRKNLWERDGGSVAVCCSSPRLRMENACGSRWWLRLDEQWAITIFPTPSLPLESKNNKNFCPVSLSWINK